MQIGDRVRIKAAIDAPDDLKGLSGVVIGVKNEVYTVHVNKTINGNTSFVFFEDEMEIAA